MTIDTSSTSAAGARDDLAGRHVALVAHVVREMLGRVPSSVDGNDLLAAGLLALLEAARDTDRSSRSFADRATVRVRGAVVDELRSVDWAVRAACPRDPVSARARLDAVLAQFPGAAAAAAALELAGGPSRPSAPSREGRVDPRTRHGRREDVARALESLPDDLRHVARGYFLEQLPMAELAAQVGTSEEHVARLRDEALVVLRDAVATAADLEPESDRVGADAGGANRHELRRHAGARALALQHTARQALAATPGERTTA